MDKIYKIKKKQDGRYSSGLYKKMFGCPLYIQNTKKACFVRFRGCPYAPIHLDAPCMFRCCHMFGWPTCMFGHPMFGHPHMFGCPLMLRCSLCLDTPLYGQMPPHVWTPPCMFGFPPYVWLPPVHIQHKESMLCLTKGVSICPHTFGCPHMSGCLPVYLDATNCMGPSKHMAVSKYRGGIQT